MRRILPPAVLFAVTIGSMGAPATGATCNCNLTFTTSLNVSCIALSVSGTSAQKSKVQQGATAWTSKCNSSSLKIPQIQVGNCAGFPSNEILKLEVKFLPTQPDGQTAECGFTDTDFTLGHGTLEVYDRANDGGNCTQNQEDIVSHELGHNMGFADLLPQCQLTCSGRIMSGDIYNNGIVVDRKVNTTDCNRAALINNPKPKPPRPPRPDPFIPCRAAASAEVKTWVVPLGAGLDAIDLDSASLFAGRIETVEGIPYLMEDWALVTYASDSRGRVSGTRVESSSSPVFELFGHGLGAALDEQPPTGKVLVVQGPIHPHNARHIQKPAIHLPPKAIAFLGPEGRAVVRVDIGENRRIRNIQILDVLGNLPPSIDLNRYVQEELRLVYASERDHRMIIYLVLRFANGRLEVVEQRVSLPLCCCSPLCV